MQFLAVAIQGQDSLILLGPGLGYRDSTTKNGCRDVTGISKLQIYIEF